MSDLDSIRRAAIIGVALAIAVGIVTGPMYFAAFGFDFEAALFVHPEAVLGRGTETAVLWRWGFIGDMLYSYLLFVPLALFLHRRLRERRPWLADLGLAGALAYIFIGGAAAAVLAHVGSSLIEAYQAAAQADREAILASFRLMRDALVFGVWQTVDALTAGTWVMSIGWLVLLERPIMGRLLVVLGAMGWALALMTMSGIHSLAMLAGGFAVAMVAWFGWVILERRPLARLKR